jgi:hypothetical protein
MAQWKTSQVKILYQQLQGVELKPAQCAAQVNHSRPYSQYTTIISGTMN